MNWFIAPNGTTQYRQIGSYTSFAPPGKQFVINEKLIQWHQIFKEVNPLTLILTAEFDQPLVTARDEVQIRTTMNSQWIPEIRRTKK